MEAGLIASASGRSFLQGLAELVAPLSPDDQAAVRDSICFLKEKKGMGSPFLSAVNEFIEEHPELLRCLVK